MLRHVGIRARNKQLKIVGKTKIKKLRKLILTTGSREEMAFMKERERRRKVKSEGDSMMI